MTDPTPHNLGEFLNADQTALLRLETERETQERKIMTTVAQYAPMAVKAFALAPLLGGFAVSLPLALCVTGAGLAVSRYLFNKSAPADDEKIDIATPEGQKAFSHLPAFADDLSRLCKEAGLEKVPKIIMGEPGSFTMGMFHHKGEDILYVSPVMCTHLQRDELNAVIAHEICHAKLKHSSETINRAGYEMAGKVLTVAAIGASLLNPLTAIPVILAVAASNLAGKAVSSHYLRKKEEVCDRAAGLLCGGAKNLAAALSKLDQVYAQYGPKRTKAPSVLEEKLPRKWADILRTIKKDPHYKNMHRFIHASYPKQSTRVAKLHRFEAAHPVFCESRRAIFSQSFNQSAAPARPEYLPEQFTNRMKYQIKKTS